MANALSPKVTSLGCALLVSAMSGGTMEFTRIVLGNGSRTEDGESMINPRISVGLTNLSVGDNYVSLTGLYDNSQISTGFNSTELGVYARGTGSNNEEVLYAYRYQTEGVHFIPAGDSGMINETLITVTVAVGDADNITAVLVEASAYASKEAFENHIHDYDNPHRVTAADVGLDLIENKAFSNQTPEFTIASNLININSGEKMSTILGKLCKLYASYITHIQASNPHSITYSKIGAAAASHKHSTDDLTSGILPVARGGTGTNSLATLLNNLTDGRHLILSKGKWIRVKETDGTLYRLAGMNSDGSVWFGAEPSEAINDQLLHLHSTGGFCIRTYRSSDGYMFYMNISQAGHVTPAGAGGAANTGVQNIGSSSRRWATVYCTGVNNSSDRKLKHDLGEIDKAKEFIYGLSPRAYFWNSDERGDYQMGFMAQDVYQVAKSLGIKNAGVYNAAVIDKSNDDEHDHFDSTEENIDDSRIDEMNDEDLGWGIDYNQIVAALVATVQNQHQEIEELKKAIKEGN